jgi:hypothetical protein
VNEEQTVKPKIQNISPLGRTVKDMLAKAEYLFHLPTHFQTPKKVNSNLF